MNTSRLLIRIGLFTTCLWITSAAGSQDVQEWSFVGGFQVGFRLVDVDGSEEKYRQHLNLEDGPRLFNLNFELTPTAEMRHLFDRIDLDITNMGGDPFETLRTSIEKYGRFSLTYDRLKSTYFYDDIILPVALGDPALSNAGDFHTFDFDRVRDTVRFNLSLGRSARLDFDFNRFTKTGESATTLDIERDEFELDKPIDESMSEYRVALQYAWPRVTLILEGRLREYENAVEIFLPGLSQGEDPEDETILGAYFLDQPYDLRSFAPSVRMVARPTDRFHVNLYASVEDLTVDVELSEHAQGTTWTGEPYESSFDGAGAVDRTVQMYDIDLSYQILDWFGVVAGARERTLEQDGALVFDEENGDSSWYIDTISAHLGVQFDFSSRFTISTGLRSENREVESDWSHADTGKTEEAKTDHNGYYLTMGWRPTRDLRISARLDDSTYDHPFTTASPTDRLAYRVAVRWSTARGFAVSGVYRGIEAKNELSSWDVSSSSTNLRLGYRLPGLSLSAGYTIINIDRQIDQLVTYGGEETLLFPISYRADSDFIDARLVWAAATRLKVGAEARWYDNAGSFAVENQDLRAFVEIGFGKGYVGHLGYRDVDHNEVAYSWNDYRAKITEVSFGYRW